MRLCGGWRFLYIFTQLAGEMMRVERSVETDDEEGQAVCDGRE